MVTGIVDNWIPDKPKKEEPDEDQISYYEFYINDYKYPLHLKIHWHGKLKNRTIHLFEYDISFPIRSLDHRIVRKTIQHHLLYMYFDGVIHQNTPFAGWKRERGDVEMLIEGRKFTYFGAIHVDVGVTEQPIEQFLYKEGE